MSIDILNYLPSYIISGVVVLILVWIITIERRIRKFLSGTKGQNLEEVMMHISRQMCELKETQIKINSHLVTVDKRLGKSIREVQMIRFKPFEDAGSNQSFALSFINDNGDGIVMSSLYARDRMSVFAKKISSGKSDLELSDEEKKVLEMSK